MVIRKNAKTENRFPRDGSPIKLFYPLLTNIGKKWMMPIRDWKAALNRFTIEFDGRMKQR